MNDQIVCAHCNGSGTCKSSSSINSCAVCIKRHRLPVQEGTQASYAGIVCSVCHGLGVSETLSVRLNRRITPLLALMIVYLVLLMIWIRSDSSNSHELLAFGGTLIGSVTGYYFGGRNARAEPRSKDAA
jgi:hypothetical protein